MLLACTIPKSGVDSFDGRSDDKGAEPEGLAMAEINGRFVSHGMFSTLPAMTRATSIGGDLVPSPHKPTMHPRAAEAD